MAKRFTILGASVLSTLALTLGTSPLGHAQFDLMFPNRLQLA